jgi:Ca2+-binding EF-hand superfamily protein
MSCAGTAGLLAVFAISTVMVIPAAEAGDQGRQRQRNNQEQQMRFKAMDIDGDGVITRSEWRGNLQSFRQHDRNNDGVLSGDEVWVGDAGAGTAQELAEVFSNADRNNDRTLSRNEWYGDLQTFERVDRNDDGRISLSEFLGGEVAGTSGVAQAFDELDRNGNGVITRNEWAGSREAFTDLDTDDDGVITRREYRQRLDDGPDDLQNQSEAYRAGYNSGLTEGRQAGAGDRRVNRWDLDGQRELEQADSGYNPQLGDRSEYQAGYRAGFRRGYRLGFGPRQ